MSATPPPTLAALLGKKTPQHFTPTQLMGKAHWRWDRDQFHAAFLLFDAAAARAAMLGETIRERSARNRAAVTHRLAGLDPGESERRLEAVIASYESAPGRDDVHFTEWAATGLLELTVARAPERFAATFFRLRERLARIGRDRFPFIQAERVAELAYQTGARDVMRIALPRVEERATRATRPPVETWKRWAEADQPGGGA